MSRFNLNDYKEVPVRVLEFWKEHPDWSITSVRIHNDKETVEFKTTISDENGIERANGHAEETKGLMSKMLSSNALEVCETSSVGRALAKLGYLGSKKHLKMAGKEEVANSVAIQEALKKIQMPKDLSDDIQYLYHLMQKKYPSHYAEISLDDFWIKLQENAIRENKKVNAEYLKTLQNKMEDK